MTEGIIQQVFKHFMFVNMNRKIGNYELYLLRKELIEKIKGVESTVPNKWQLMIKLIGDNSND